MRRAVIRDFDDNPHSYGPVFRRIAILVAVIVMVPTMLWGITSFMRTYVAQPVIASPKPLLLAPSTTASIDTPDAGASASSSAVDASTQTAAITTTGTTANDSNPPSPAAKVAALAGSDMPPSVSTAPASQSPIDAAPTQPAAAASSGLWPDPSQAIGEQNLGAQQAMPAAASDSSASDDALPPTPPLTGPIPLPPHRPAVIAMVASGAVPLPRARPADAGVSSDVTPDTGSNFFTHLFGQTH